ncbi:MAG: hypothetical protein ACTHJ2_04260 [Candidatus Nitrosocosmicus sp.]
MKTFADLKINDVIYRLCDKYELGRPDKEQIKAIKINSLSLKKETGDLLINRVDGTYSYDTYYQLVIPVSKVNETSFDFDPTKNPFRRGLYFVNIESANDIVRDTVMGKIKAIEQSIPKLIAEKKGEIENLRCVFHELLNKSHYPEYSVLTNHQ